LILHGRNESKLTKVIDEIKANGTRSDGHIKYFIAAADDPKVDFEKIAAGYKNLNLTLLVNNVGGRQTRPQRYEIFTEQIFYRLFLI